MDRDLVAGKDPDKVHPELSGNMRQNDVAVADIHLEHGVGQGFHHCALKFDYIVLCQSKFLQRPCGLNPMQNSHLNEHAIAVPDKLWMVFS